MTTVAARRTEALPPGQPPPYRFTVAQYHQMIAAGVFGEHDRVMLLEGRVVAKMVHNPPHDEAVWRVQTRLITAVPREWIVRVQSAITTADSEPEPDVAVARRRPRGYGAAHPRPKDLALVVEVAGTSLAEDRGLQGRVYARARIPAYWIVNLAGRQVEAYTRPRGGKSPAYRDRRDYAEGEAVPLILAGAEVALIPARELLPD